MIMNYIRFIIIIILFASCKEKEVTVPENILNLKEMTSILTDVHFAQASINLKIQTDSTVYDMNDYLTYILKQHKIEKDDFLISIKFYSDHPGILKQVYDSVLTEMSRIEARTVN